MLPQARFTVATADLINVCWKFFFCSQFHKCIAVFQVDSKWHDQYQLEDVLDIPCFLARLIEYKVFMTGVYCTWSCKTVRNLKTYVETDEQNLIKKKNSSFHDCIHYDISIGYVSLSGAELIINFLSTGII